jgi:glutamate-1-semialdehyde 2,1-aminomutase
VLDDEVASRAARTTPVMTAAVIDRPHLKEVARKEREAFIAGRPRSRELVEIARRNMPSGVPMSWMAADNEIPVYVAEGRGSRFRDVDGHDYLDTNIADMSMFCGYAPEPVVEAVSARVRLGTQFLLPTEDSIAVASELARRYGLPGWQFTLSASGANTESIRLSRAATGRDAVLFFDGHYHGHFDEATVTLDHGEPGPFGSGLPAGVTRNVRIVQFNDEEAVRQALEPRDVAIVLTEPALTNNLGLQLPKPGFHEALRRVTRETGTILAYDETHTHVVGPGGCTSLWGLEPDVVTIGKAIAGGIPLGAYGMSAELAGVMEREEVATGGTLFANALSAAAARATLAEVLTPQAYGRASALGTMLADGIQKAIADAGLPWTAHRFGPRSGTTLGPDMPADARDARETFDAELFRALRLWLANRGVWEALVGAGPTMSIAADEADVERYLEGYGSFLRAIAG